MSQEKGKWGEKQEKLKETGKTGKETGKMGQEIGKTGQERGKVGQLVVLTHAGGGFQVPSAEQVVLEGVPGYPLRLQVKVTVSFTS